MFPLKFSHVVNQRFHPCHRHGIVHGSTHTAADAVTLQMLHVINGGGVINAAAEVDGPYNKEEVLVKVDNIYNSIERILSESKQTGEPEGVIATRYAESLIYG